MIAQNIFDPNDNAENNRLYMLVNRLHIQTREDVIARVLLFRAGETVSRQKIDETERMLRSVRYLYDVNIRAVGLADGAVDIEVRTRDTWSLDVGASVSRTGGNNKTNLELSEYNLLGTGTRLGISRRSDIDRNGSQFEIGYSRAFDGWTELQYLRGQFNDGSRRTASVVRAFPSLDARWAAGISWDREDRIDSIYNTGNLVADYRHGIRAGEVFGGWSPGLVEGWTQRFTAGLLRNDNSYRVEPGKTPPMPLPVDQLQRAGYLRYELIEDRYLKLYNRSQIARSEFIANGLNLRLQVARNSTELGASQSAWLLSVSASRGFTPGGDHNLLTAASWNRRISTTGELMDVAAASVRYFVPESPRWLFYASLAADRVRNGGIADQLLLGGINGLRGYPDRYQAGDKRVLATFEQRLYTTWYPFRLFRIGAAAFVDVGRAWGGPNQNTINGGWLGDAGVGLRVAIDRAAFANMLHLDIATPLKRQGDIKSTQFLVRTEFSF
ncbi:hypothetical protein [Casimicrobium huifangae]|uniref:hypothetical protein n=1 Tax=Casimicrobium huifangae TaxID=2591109 RepID=UPI0037831B31